MRAEVGVTGVNALAKACRNAGEQWPDELKRAHLESAELVADAARPLVPKRSGDLLGSLRHGASARSGRVSSGKKLVPYAGPIHFGWTRRGIRPQPFLYDALDRRRDEVLDTFLERAQAIADRIAEETNSER